jgi:hypothetical protein
VLYYVQQSYVQQSYVQQSYVQQSYVQQMHLDQVGLIVFDLYKEKNLGSYLYLQQRI